MWIGISGKMGVGKDYFAKQYLIPFIEHTLKKKCLIISFADVIKLNIMVHNNITIDMLTGDKSNNVRTLLIKEGHDKKCIHGNDIWIRYTKAMGDLYMARGIDHIIITDLRFKNEYEFVKNMNGHVIRINAPRRNEIRLRKESNNEEQYNTLVTHISETDLDNIIFDHVIDNDVNTNTGVINNIFNIIFHITPTITYV